MSIGFYLMAEPCAHKKKYKILKKNLQKKKHIVNNSLPIPYFPPQPIK